MSVACEATVEKRSLLVNTSWVLLGTVAFAATLFVACGDETSRSTPATPSVTIRPTATPTPSPPTSTTYRLAEGSTISFTTPPATPGAGNTEALAGTFTVASALSPSPNTFFMFTIKTLEFHSASYSVVGVVGKNGCNGEDDAVGCIQSTTFAPTEVQMIAVVSINGRDLTVEGTGPRPAPPESFNLLRVCEVPSGSTVTCDMIANGSAGGYTLLLMAQPN
jgi:hypothetical protein